MDLRFLATRAKHKLFPPSQEEIQQKLNEINAASKKRNEE